MEKLLIEGIKTKVITPKDDVMKVLKESLHPRKIDNGDIIVISSKVIAITQGRIVKIESEEEFENIVKHESDEYFGGEVTLTKKNGIFTPWAGIDRSNVEKQHAILWPKTPFKEAIKIREQVKEEYKLEKLGIIISDSFCAPLRRGVSGIAIGYAGIIGVKDYRGKNDIFGNKLTVSQSSVVDMLSSAAQLVMGEADEKTPFALIKGANIEFTDKKPNELETIMDSNKCFFSPIYPN